MNLIEGSLCTGYNGLGLALDIIFGADVRLGFVADPDPDASKVLAHHYPDVPNLGDITRVDWDTVQPVDILTAGYPCQGFSLAGQRKGMEDERFIWPHVADAVRVLRPRLVLLENVAGHRSLGFGRVLADLAGLGYVGSWCSVRASDVGAPHQRERVFILAWPAADTTSNEGRIVDGNPRPATDPNGDGRQPCVGPLSESTSDAAGRDSSNHDVALLPTPTARRYGSNQSPSPGAAVRPGLDSIASLLPTPTTREGSGPGRLDGNRSDTLRAQIALLKTPTAQLAVNGGSQHPGKRRQGGHGPTLADEVEHLLPTPWASDGAKGGPNQRGSSGDLMLPSAVQPGRWGRFEAAVARWEEVSGNPAPEPTESGRTGQRLSPVFVEWMMGLEKGWVTEVDGLSRNAMLRLLGNGVLPQQGAAAAERLLASIRRR